MSSARLGSGLRRVRERIRTTNARKSEERTAQWGSELTAPTAIKGCTDRSIVSVSGMLRSVTALSDAHIVAVEAELFDGNDSVTLIWLGRREIAGIEPGRGLTARGRIGHQGRRRVMFNPRYGLNNAAGVWR